MKRRRSFDYVEHEQPGPLYHYGDERPLLERCAPLLWTFIIAVVIAVTILFVAAPRVRAQVPCPANLWKGLIAEATSDGYDGMYAVACCVRNRLARGMNTGLCGLKRKDLDTFVKREGSKRERQAKEIIRRVFEDGSDDTTKGATHFESTRYKTPSWARGAVVTCQVGEHVFYKGVR